MKTRNFKSDRRRSQSNPRRTEASMKRKTTRHRSSCNLDVVRRLSEKFESPNWGGSKGGRHDLNDVSAYLGLDDERDVETLIHLGLIECDFEEGKRPEHVTAKQLAKFLRRYGDVWFAGRAKRLLSTLLARCERKRVDSTLSLVTAPIAG